MLYPKWRRKEQADTQQPRPAPVVNPNPERETYKNDASMKKGKRRIPNLNTPTNNITKWEEESSILNQDGRNQTIGVEFLPTEIND